MARTENRIVVEHLRPSLRMYYVSDDLPCMFEHEHEEFNRRQEAENLIRSLENVDEADFAKAQVEIMERLTALGGGAESPCSLQSLQDDANGILVAAHINDIVTVQIHLAKRDWDEDVEPLVVRTIAESFGWSDDEYEVVTAAV